MSLESLFFDFAALIPSRLGNGSVVAVCYHRLSNQYDGSSLDRFTITPDLFSRHLSAIADSGLDVIGPDKLSTVSKPAVMLTFDDNLLSHMQYAVPILTDFGLTATFFLNPAEIDRPGLLTSSDVEGLLSAGMWIGAHNNDRTVASLYEPEDFEREVVLCREYLESIDMPLCWAYPGGYIGSFDNAHDEILKEQGFGLRFSTLEKPCDPLDLGHVQGRYVIRRDCSDRYFNAVLAGGLQMLRVYKEILAKVWPASKSRGGMTDVPRF
jgi:peptidoglycan/xylan/chitin deacetylase (PgdA/CDA1 family)